MKCQVHESIIEEYVFTYSQPLEHQKIQAETGLIDQAHHPL